MLGILLLVRCYQTRDLVSELPMRELVDSEGRHLSLVGQGPTLVHTFATWCGVCRVEEGSVQRVSSSARVISIASRSGSPAEVRAYMREHGLTYPVVLDADGSLAQKLGVHAFPSSFFVDEQGEVFTREVGYTTELGMRIRLWLAGF